MVDCNKTNIVIEKTNVHIITHLPDSNFLLLWRVSFVSSISLMILASIIFCKKNPLVYLAATLTRAFTAHYSVSQLVSTVQSARTQ